jgi:hypothetical protein
MKEFADYYERLERNGGGSRTRLGREEILTMASCRADIRRS